MTPIYQLMDSLPVDSINVRALKALDFVAPGQWQNIVGFDNMITYVTGETDPTLMYQIRQRAEELYNDPSQGYQRGMWVYQTVDHSDKVLGGLAAANMVGQKVGFLGFLTKLTPKEDTAQQIDLSVKMVAELVAFTNINGLPGDSIGDFVQALGAYERESLIRMAALVCFDGLVPLGPDFLSKALNGLQNSGPGKLAENQTFQRLASMIPGGDVNGQFNFIGTAVQNIQGWVGNFVGSTGVTQQSVIANLSNYLDGIEGKLDYLGAFLDMYTNYFEHTGTQSLSRSLISRAAGEI